VLPKLAWDHLERELERDWEQLQLREWREPQGSEVLPESGQRQPEQLVLSEQLVLPEQQELRLDHWGQGANWEQERPAGGLRRELRLQE